MSKQVIYIDADIFWHATGVDEKACERRLGRDNLASIKTACEHNSEIEVVVPQVIIGECFVNAFEDEIDISRCLEEVKDLEPSLENPTNKTLTKTLELIEADYELDINDALFISQALCNLDTSIIISTDSAFRTSRPVLESLRKHPKKPKVRATFRVS